MCHKRELSESFALDAHYFYTSVSLTGWSDDTCEHERKRKRKSPIIAEVDERIFFSSFRSLTSLSLHTRTHIYLDIHIDSYLLPSLVKRHSPFFVASMTRHGSARLESKTKVAKKDPTKVELKKLKSLLPTLKQKSTSSPIEIVLETIRYIRELEDQLIDRFQMDALDSSSSSSSSHSGMFVSHRSIVRFSINPLF